MTNRLRNHCRSRRKWGTRPV